MTPSIKDDGTAANKTHRQRRAQLIGVSARSAVFFGRGADCKREIQLYIRTTKPK